MLWLHDIVIVTHYICSLERRKETYPSSHLYSTKEQQQMYEEIYHDLSERNVCTQRKYPLIIQIVMLFVKHC